MKTYRGIPAHVVVVDVNDGGRQGFIGTYPLSLHTELRNHSPTGFSWGYAGSGPSQLALALLVDVLGPRLALANYQQFKFAFIAGLKGDEPWTLTDAEIERLARAMPGFRDEAAIHHLDGDPTNNAIENLLAIPTRAEGAGSRDAAIARGQTERAQTLSGPSVMPEPPIEASDIAWEQTGEEFPASRLLATIVVAGCRMHLEAYAVEENLNEGNEQTFPGDYGDVPDKVYEAVGGDGAWHTVTINGREYVLIATPFCT